MLLSFQLFRNSVLAPANKLSNVDAPTIQFVIVPVSCIYLICIPFHLHHLFLRRHPSALPLIVRVEELAVVPVSASSCREIFDAKAVFVRAVLAILGVVISSPVVILIAISHVPPVVRLLQSLKTT